MPLLFVLSFVAGVSSLIFETVWIHRFSFVFGSTAPAASAVVAVFLLGLAIGSCRFERRQGLTGRFDLPQPRHGGEVSAEPAGIGKLRRQADVGDAGRVAKAEARRLCGKERRRHGTSWERWLPARSCRICPSTGRRWQYPWAQPVAINGKSGLEARAPSEASDSVARLIPLRPALARRCGAS